MIETSHNLTITYYVSFSSRTNVTKLTLLVNYFETGLFALFLLTNTNVIENFVHRIIFHMQHISFQTNNITIGV